ncbi:MAG: NTP transferase domain-containing protein [Candidatus Eisenbacteria bacterium]|nr:NTP transferase domain-containing protein [Candidatus Eisenbacteria bacterium]
MVRPRGRAGVEAMEFSALLLCGGASRRFGSPKCLVSFRGEPLAQRLARRLAEVSDDVLVSANDPGAYAFLERSVIPDDERGHGPLAGLAAGLRAARHPWLAVVAGDMPFASPPLLRLLFEARRDAQIVVPMHRTGHRARAAQRDLRYEPLHALYHRDCLAPIERAIAHGERRIVRLFPQMRVRGVTEEAWARIPDVGERTFANINTTDDLARLEAEDG